MNRIQWRQLLMKTPSLQPGNLLSLVLLAALAGGCATPALWKSTARREWKPSTPDQVVLITNTNHQRAVAVFFCQVARVEGTTTSRDVGWRLGQSPKELALTPRAIGQLTNSCGEFRSVPLFLAGGVPPDASSQSPGYAVWNSTDQQLTVYLDGYPCGPYLLPTTQTDQHTAMRALGMPFALAADAAIGLGAIIWWIGPGFGAGAGP
jgi:hypothetical protein